MTSWKPSQYKVWHMPKYNRTIQPITVTRSNASGRTHPHLILSLLRRIRLTVLYLLCAQRPNGSQQLPPWPTLQRRSEGRRPTQWNLMLTYAWNTGRATGKLTCENSANAFFLHDIRSTELPWYCFSCRAYFTDLFHTGRMGKRCLLTFYPLQNWLSGILEMDSDWQGLSL